jgi:hypothetical protein
MTQPQLDNTDEPPVPECIMRDNLTSPYIPNTSLNMLLSIISVAAVFLFTSFHRLNHTDLWGHVNFGRWMVEHRALPASDPIVLQPSTEPMLHAGWAGQTVFFLTEQSLGLEGLSLLHALLVAATAALLIIAVRARGVPLSFAWPAGILFFFLALPQIGSVRPQLFGQLAAAAVLLGCALLPSKRHPLYWLPIVFLLWANLHGSAIIGFAILGLAGLGAALEIVFPKYLAEESAETEAASPPLDTAAIFSAVTPFALALALSIAASCLNPEGPLLFVRSLALSQHEGVRAFSEWQPLRPASLTGVLLIASTLAAALIFKHNLPKMPWGDWLWLAVFALLTLSAIRMLAWWALIWPVAVLPHAYAVWQARRKAAADDLPVELSEEPTAMRTLIALSFVFMTLIVAPPSYALLMGEPRGVSEIVASGTPLYLADELNRRETQGALAAPLEWSDFLVHQTGGRVQPLLDIHLHLQSTAAWRDYQRIYGADPTWLERLRANNVRYFAISRVWNARLVPQLLAADRDPKSGVRLLYQDQQALLVEIGPSTSPAPATPEIGKPAQANGG